MQSKADKGMRLMLVAEKDSAELYGFGKDRAVWARAASEGRRLPDFMEEVLQ